MLLLSVYYIFVLSPIDRARSAPNCLVYYTVWHDCSSQKQRQKDREEEEKSRSLGESGRKLEIREGVRETPRPRRKAKAGSIPASRIG
jgi:hypothetical protein